jgi:hypothetical protein
MLEMEGREGMGGLGQERLSQLVNGTASEVLHRELLYSGALTEGASYSSRLLTCLVLLD